MCETGGLKSALQGVLVIAHSGRMLAQSVRLAGYNPLVIDLYADQDTAAVAEQRWQVKNLSLAVVQSVVEKIILYYKVQWVIYGSGMENQPETLVYLAEMFSVTGNNATVCQQLSNKKSFFKQLSILDIPYPELSFNVPKKMTNWLIKPINHFGGLGISWCNRIANKHEYYQKFCPGKAGSVLFCADGQQVDLIGFHRQWTLNGSFVFSGIVQECVLPVAEQKRIQGWLEKLVSCYHFKGLGSLDFICNEGTCYFLEINPRPPASMQLYPELDLLAAHITGRLSSIKEQKTVCAIQIVYARQACYIKQNIQWPDWSFDRPRISTNIKVNNPICTIMAQENTVQQTLDSLLDKQKIIENTLY